MLDFCVRAGARDMQDKTRRLPGCPYRLLQWRTRVQHPRDTVFATEQGLRSHRAKAD